MKPPRPRALRLRFALATLSLFALALGAHAQDPKPAQTPPVRLGVIDPSRVSKEEVGADRPFRMNEVERKPVITFKPKPDFTDEALDEDVYGIVRLRAVFSSKGEVKNITVDRGLPYGLNERAIDAAKQIRFMPARKDGQDVSAYVTLEYDFNIRDEDADKKVVILEEPQPVYTEEARGRGLSGRIVIDVRFLKEGVVAWPKVVEGPPGGLTAEVIEALRGIKFVPAELRGRKVTVYKRVVYAVPPDAAPPAKQ